MSTDISLGKKIRQARLLKGLNQAELADRLGVTQAAISMFEKDHRQPTPKMIDEMCEILDVAIKELIGEQEEAFEVNILMRSIKGLTPEQIKKINEYAEYIKEKR